jgi:hypothetical protein
MNRRILIATVAALSIGGITAASAEYDSSGAGTINPERFGYQGYSSGGYDAYGSATIRGPRVTTDSQYLGSRAYRTAPQGGRCLDEDGNRFACR